MRKMPHKTHKLLAAAKENLREAQNYIHNFTSAEFVEFTAALKLIMYFEERLRGY